VPSEQANMQWDKDLIFVGSVAEPLTMAQGHSAANFGIPIHPMENKCLQHQLGIGQVPGTILLKRFKEFGIEPVRSLDGQGFAGGDGGFDFDVLLCHKYKSYLIGIIAARLAASNKPINFGDDIDFE